jgi:hypothetical protein
MSAIIIILPDPRKVGGSARVVTRHGVKGGRAYLPALRGWQKFSETQKLAGLAVVWCMNEQVRAKQVPIQA